MCGRFVSASPPDELARYFGASTEGVEESLLDPSYNVAPTNDIYAIVDGPEGRRLTVLHWGLVPVWAKDLKVGSKMINARAETVASSTAYKTAFKKRRCIIPVDGFYEWKKVAGQKAKQPYYISRLDGEPLAFAGLWERWHPPDDRDATLYSGTIITTSANDTMAPVHNRMPVILPASEWDKWLDPNVDDVTALGKLLVPAPNNLLTLHPVSTRVNVVREKSADLIEPVEAIEPASLEPEEPAE